VCNEITAHKEAVKAFLAADPDEIILKSGACYSKDQNSIAVAYFAQPHAISLTDGTITAANRQPVAPKDATLILQYLTQCSGLPPRGKWISFLELPQGSHHYTAFLEGACNPINEALSQDPDLFIARAALLGGRPLKMGDAAAVIPAFPKLPLAIVIWQGDDEFPAKTNILLDSVSPSHLSTAALWVLVCLMADKMVA